MDVREWAASDSEYGIVYASGWDHGRVEEDVQPEFAATLRSVAHRVYED
jgi:hypothetical protein